MNWIGELFDGSDFPPRWECGNWSDFLGWVHIGSDVVVFLCYTAIPVMILWFKKRRPDVPFPKIFTLFAAFIWSCGMTHLIEAMIFWNPVYRLSGLAKFTTASVSMATVATLFPALPQLFALRSAADLAKEVEQRRAAEVEVKRVHGNLEALVEERTRELTRERERLALALHAGQMGIVEIEPNEQVVALDDAARTVFSIDESNVGLAQLCGVLDVSDAAQLQHEINHQGEDSEGRFSLTLRTVVNGSTERVVELRGVRVADGCPRILAVVWDATELSQAREQRQRLSEILEATPDFVVTADAGGTFLWQNASLRRWLEEAGAKDVRGIVDIVPSDESERIVERAIPKALAAGTWVGESAVAAGSTRREVSQLLVAHRDGFGRVSHFSSIMRDLSDIKAREKQLKESEARMRAAVEAAPNAMAMVDGEGAIRLYNAEFVRLFGYSPRELTTLVVDQLVAPEKLEGHKNDRVRYLRTPSRRPMGGDRQLYGRHKTGRMIPLEIGLNPVELAGERLILVAIVDISERLLAREAIAYRERHLLQVNESLSEFAYAASHDLQEPMRKVAGFCQLLELELGDDASEKARQYLGFAVDASTRMQNLVRDLLEYSRLSDGQHPLASVSAEDCARSAVDTLSEAIAQSGGVVRIGPLPRVRAHEVLLERVFSNLIGNAIKYRAADRPPEVDVEAVLDGAVWRFTVRDNGIGIDPSNHERIFRVFQRLHGRDAYPGTGIGLAIVKRAIDRCGGRIWVESELGKGTTVLFTLEPAADESLGDLSG